MMKLKILKSAFLAFAVVTLFGINACNQAAEPTNTTSGSINPTEYVVAQYDVNSYDVMDATLNSDMTVETIVPPNADQPCIMGNNKGFRPPMMSNPLGKVIRDLKLTADQLKQIKTFMKSHAECEFSWLKKLAASQRVIIKDANDQRKIVIQKLKDSLISPAEARTQIKDINIATRQALKNNPVNEEVKLGLKDCMDTFIADVSSILTSDQLVIWNKFIESLPPRKG